MAIPVRIPLQILLLLSISLPLITSDPVNINIDFNCEPGIFWCGELLIYEQDFKTSHDEWYNETFCTDEPLQTFRIGPLLPGGDVSPEYEIGLQLAHNCSMDSLLRCYEPNIRHISVYDEETVEYNITLFQKGIERECYPPNNLPWDNVNNFVENRE